MLANDVAPTDVAAVFSGGPATTAAVTTMGSDNLHSGVSVQF